MSDVRNLDIRGPYTVKTFDDKGQPLNSVILSMLSVAETLAERWGSMYPTVTVEGARGEDLLMFVQGQRIQGRD